MKNTQNTTNTIPQNTMQYNTIKTTQHNTIHYYDIHNTLQISTIQKRAPPPKTFFYSRRPVGCHHFCIMFMFILVLCSCYTSHRMHIYVFCDWYFSSRACRAKHNNAHTKQSVLIIICLCQTMPRIHTGFQADVQLPSYSIDQRKN